MSSPKAKANIVPFRVPPRGFLAAFLALRPVFRPFVDLLPSSLRGSHRMRCERLLGLLFREVVYIPKLTEDQIRTIILHGKNPRKIAYRELEFMRRNLEWATVVSRWIDVWEEAEDGEELQFVRYATAMLCRVYRLEYATRIRGVVHPTNE